MRALFLAAMLLASPALAHDKWADGSDIPAWVKSACCGPSDAHMYPPIHRNAAGEWCVDGLKLCKANDEILPSQDGHVWVFYSPFAGSDAWIYCFFIPMTM